MGADSRGLEGASTVVYIDAFLSGDQVDPAVRKAFELRASYGISTEMTLILCKGLSGAALDQLAENIIELYRGPR